MQTHLQNLLKQQKKLWLNKTIFLRKYVLLLDTIIKKELNFESFFLFQILTNFVFCVIYGIGENNMEFNENEERIIARVLSGELSFSSEDIESLESLDLSEENENDLKKLAYEIIEKVDENKKIRSHVKEKIEQVEEDWFDHINLLRIEDDIRNLKEEEEKIKNSRLLSRGIIATIASTALFTLLASIFLNSTFLSLLFVMVGFNIGFVPTVLLMGKREMKQENIKKQIEELENERLVVLNLEKDKQNKTEKLKEINVVKRVYENKDIQEEKDRRYQAGNKFLCLKACHLQFYR